MKLIVLITVFVAHGHSQFIFPDEFESTNSPRNYGRNAQRRLPFPTLPAAIAASINQNIPAFTYNGRDYWTATAKVEPESETSTQPSLVIPSGIFDEQNYWTNQVNRILARDVTQFALRLNNAINQNKAASAIGADRDNVVFSPLNIVSTLMVILVAAAGRTFDETVNLLGFDVDFDVSRHSEAIHHIFGSLLNSVELGSKTTARRQATNGTEISMAEGVFVQDDYAIRPEFRSIAENIYKSDVINVDFQRAPDVAKDTVNNWVNSKTRGKIHNILDASPDETTKVILASALYFKGDWNQHFIKGATKRKPFFLATGQTINIDMMYNGGSFPFYEDRTLGVKILGLPYKDDGINSNNEDAFHSGTTMYVLLPTSSSANAISGLQSRLSPEIIDRLISQMKTETCIIGIPRMKLSSAVNLNYALQSLGLTSLFNPVTSDLGLLSFGLNDMPFSTSTDDSVIFPRINVDESTTVTPNKVFTGKKNYIRYEDAHGGYIVEQWDNGVYFEKIRRVYRHRRNTSEGSKEKDGNIPKYETPNTGGGNTERVKIISLDDNKYRFEKMKRNRRQVRGVDSDFLKFIESKKYHSYNLDALRNQRNFGNPGLFASDVLHKVEIDITETGTVAAAATGVIIRRNGNQKRLIANRPFLFFIRHEPSELILFWGTVNKPTPNYT